MPVTSPEGTPLPERTVGELVAVHPMLSRVFQRHGIDFCCQGGRTLAAACDSKGIACESIVAEIEQEMMESSATELPNPAGLPPAELADYIVAKHHHFLKNEMPRLHAMSERVARVHGGHTPSLIEVFDVFTGLKNELDSHMMKEEMVLFPAVRTLAEGGHAMPLDGPIACMIHEHDVAGAALTKLRELTNAFTPPPEACNTYRALFAGLAELESDLNTHIHLENSVLFPAAERMVGDTA